MKPEIEAKFLNVNHDELRAKLKELGAECAQPMRLMKRKNYDFPDRRLDKGRNGWVRVRDEGGKITMSYKQLNNRELDGTHEVNITIDSFDAADSFLREIGLEPKTYQVTKRESWRYENFEIELDEWPWAKPYIEIEGPDEQSLKGLAEKLDLDWGRVCHGSVEVVYRAEYDVTDEEVDNIPVINFENSVPEVLESKRR
ncbi:MAG: class IV adenylate cyclase [Candidatus Saccharimonadales bacterium]